VIADRPDSVSGSAHCLVCETEKRLLVAPLALFHHRELRSSLIDNGLPRLSFRHILRNHGRRRPHRFVVRIQGSFSSGLCGLCVSVVGIRKHFSRSVNKGGAIGAMRRPFDFSTQSNRKRLLRYSSSLR